MNDEAVWSAYADENLAVARLSLERGYYNACLQNAQQAVEKYLKFSLLRNNVPFSKTHSILTLRTLLADIGVDVNLTDQDCDLLDSIYLPSKYPLGAALPDFAPDEKICQRIVDMAVGVQRAVSISK